MLNSKFSKDILTLISGTTCAQIIIILASPLITRLFSPEAFGLAALFTSITSIFGVIICFRYELAIMLPESDEEAANVFGLCVVIAIFISLLSIPFLIVGQQSLIQYLKVPQFAQYVWLIPIGLFVSGMILACNYWNTRTKNFQPLSISRIASSFLTTGIQMGGGVLGYTSGVVLIGANLLGQFLTMLILSIQILKDYYHFFKCKINRKKMYEVSIHYNNFPKYDMWAALLNSISWQIPILLLTYFFSTTIVGNYSLGMVVIQMPMTIIGGAIAQVFYQKATEAKFKGNLRPLVLNFFYILVKIGMFPFLILAFIGKDLFIFFFGSPWGEAGMYVQILCPWAFFWFITSPISTIIPVLGKLKINLIINILMVLLRTISFIIGGIFGSIFLAICLFSASGFFLIGFSSLLFLSFVDVPMRKTMWYLISNFLIFTPAAIILFVSDFFLSPIFMIVLAILMVFMYYIYIIFTNNQIKDLFIGIIH